MTRFKPYPKHSWDRQSVVMFSHISCLPLNVNIPLLRTLRWFQEKVVEKMPFLSYLFRNLQMQPKYVCLCRHYVEVICLIVQYKYKEAVQLHVEPCPKGHTVPSHVLKGLGIKDFIPFFLWDLRQWQEVHNFQELSMGPLWGQWWKILLCKKLGEDGRPWRKYFLKESHLNKAFKAWRISND